MKKNVIKTAIAAVCIVVAGVTGMKAYNVANQSKASILLAENVDAFCSSEPEPDDDFGNYTRPRNGYVYKSNPSSKKTCYRHYVDKNKTHTLTNPDGTTFIVYYNSFHKYTVSECAEYKIDEVPGWWSTCNGPRLGLCNSGDFDSRPSNFEYWTDESGFQYHL